MADHTEVRTPSQKDVDKFPYSLPFRRLARITQVVSDDDSGIPHNRMTHSMKVAQVGHRLAQKLLSDDKSAAGIASAGGLDPDVVYAAGLSHDIGHPPWGHRGERVLDHIARANGLDGFEGNAQTFRILTRLTRHFGVDASETKGMNLSDTTLAATVKYPWPRHAEGTPLASKKWGYYPDDAEVFDQRVRAHLRGGRKTLAAQVMDWADDITYAVHDIEDFYTSGKIPLHRLKRALGDDGIYRAANPYDNEFDSFWSYASTRLRAADATFDPESYRTSFERYASQFPEGPYEEESGTARARVGRTVSNIITDASAACAVNTDGALEIDPKMQAVVSIMKQLTWYYVIDRPEMAMQQTGQARVLRKVTRFLIKWAYRQTSAYGNGRLLDGDERLANRRQLPVWLVEILRGNDLFSVAIPTLSDATPYGSPEFVAALKKYDRARKEVVTRSVLDFVGLQTEAEIMRLYSTIRHGGVEI